MNRRDFLQAAAVLTAGASVLPQGWSMNPEQQAFLAAQPNYIARETADFFTELQRAAVSAMAEQVFPATDTPGAIDAGVPRFIELMVADWFNDGERLFFMEGLAEVLHRAGGDFTALPPEEQLKLLEQLEEEASDAAWYQIANTQRIWDESAPFICQFKELCVLGFFLSEVGATEVLRQNPMGSFEGGVPLGKDDSAYNTLIPLRMLPEA